jgi:hypothetical protein
VNTALDAGFASAMTIRPKWAKDICSILFGAYYLVWATEGDEVVRRWSVSSMYSADFRLVTAIPSSVYCGNAESNLGKDE